MSNAAAKLMRRYNLEVIALAPVRQLMASVAQNPQVETVSYVDSMASVRRAALALGAEAVGEARRAIIAYLNEVYFVGADALPDEWWFEMHTRLNKMCIVSMILEGDNLRSFGATPEASDIPQALIVVKAKMIEKRKVFPKLAVGLASMFDDLPNDYVNCYLKK